LKGALALSDLLAALFAKMIGDGPPVLAEFGYEFEHQLVVVLVPPVLGTLHPLQTPKTMDTLVRVSARQLLGNYFPILPVLLHQLQQPHVLVPAPGLHHTLSLSLLFETKYLPLHFLL
jgi:hypothetical protein